MPRLTVTFILTFHLTSGIYRLMRMKGIVCNIMKELFELITDIVQQDLDGGEVSHTSSSVPRSDSRLSSSGELVVLSQSLPFARQFYKG
jgi:hypothetical protein